MTRMSFSLTFLMLLSDEERSAICQQVAWYKENRELLQFGQLIRTESGWIIRDGDRQLEFDLRDVAYTDTIDENAK